MGYFTLDKVWTDRDGGRPKHEINLSAEYLNGTMYEISNTLLHEMVHYNNSVNGVKDCNGQIHNKKFKESAEAVGFIVEKSKKYGFGHTSCGAELIEFIDTNVYPNPDAFEFFRNLPPQPEKETKEKTIFNYVCPQCQKKIKAKAGVRAICGNCEVEFEIEE
jgi:hypothetical protein